MGAALLPAALLGVATGILLGDAGLLPGASTGLVAAGGLAVVFGALTRRAPLLASGVLLLALVAGAWRGAATALPTGPGSVASLAGQVRGTISGTVSEDPRPRGERQQVVLTDIRVTTGTTKAPSELVGKVLVWLPRGIAVLPGDRITFDGQLDEPQDFDGFAYRAYLARQGIAAVSSAYRVQVNRGSRGPLADGLTAARDALLRGLLSVVPEPEGALGAGILLGVRASIAPAVSDDFATAGLTHVVAISGWNIAIVAALAAAATRSLLRLRGGRLLAVAVAGSAVAGYVLLTGASPSVVRAALMAAGLVLARLGGSPGHAISALMLAALGMLLAAPPVLWDVGFQLSALATAGLIWFGAPIERRLSRWPALVREPVALTLAAQLTTLPVILLNFERLSLVSPAANVVVVPLVPLVMLCSAIAAAIGAVDAVVHVPLAGDLLVWAAGGAAWLYLRLMIMAGALAAAVPFASVPLAAPAWLAGAWYPALWLAHRRLRMARPAETHAQPPVAGTLARPLPLAAGTAVLLAVLTFATRGDGLLHVVMLDVGQGDAIAIRAPSGATMLIDGGPDPDVAIRRLGELLPFWQRTLDIVLLTHPHEDHVAGLIPALERYRVSLILEPGRDYENPSYARFHALAAAEPGASLVLARSPMVLTLDQATRLRVLFPSEADARAPLPDGDINNASVVVQLESPGFRALLTGDAEAPVEALLLGRGALGPVDLLKVGHHGSDSSSTPPFLAALDPRLALISVGAGNEYGHPHAVTLEHLAAIDGLRIMRTDLDGTVDVVVDDGVLRIERRGPPDAGSIGPWAFRTPSARRRSSTRSSSRTASSATRVGWRGSPRKRRGWWRRPGCRWTCTWSRSPPCCTT